MTVSLQQSYSRTQQMMLDGFAAIKNIWQLKEDSNGNKYALSAYDIVTNGGITMYGIGNHTASTIMDGILVDGTTISIVDGRLSVIGDIGGGTANGIKVNGSVYSPDEEGIITIPNYPTSLAWNDITGKPGWIGSTKPSYSWDEINSKPSVFPTDWGNVSEKPSWIEDSKPSYGFSEISNKPTTLAGYGITDAYTKNDVTGLLGDYVTLEGAQDIAGVKSFVNGLNIGDILVKKHASGVVEIDGDLIVTGGITMYAQGSHSASTIMDGLILDPDTLTIVNDRLTVVGGTGGGGSVDNIIYGTYSFCPDSNKAITLPNFKYNADGLSWGIPSVGTDGVMEVGQYIDFHYPKNTNDYDARIYTTGYNTLTLQGNTTIRGDFKNEDNMLAVYGTYITMGNIIGGYFDANTTQNTFVMSTHKNGTYNKTVMSSSIDPGFIMFYDNVLVNGSLKITTTEDNIITFEDQASERYFAIALRDNSSLWARLILDGRDPYKNMYWEWQGNRYMVLNEYNYAGSLDGRYVKKSGDTMTGGLFIDNAYPGITLMRNDSDPYIRFASTGGTNYGEIGVGLNGQLHFWPAVSSAPGYNRWNSVLYEGNYASIIDSRYLKKSGDIITGELKITYDEPYIRVLTNGTDKGGFGANGSGPYIYNASRGNYLYYKDDGRLLFEGNTVWHSGNDGSGSGLDADLLDGYHETSFVRSFWTNNPRYDMSSNARRPFISFTYGNNAPFTGGFIDVSANGYGFYLGTNYGGDNSLYYRRHGVDGDGGMGGWQQLARVTDNVASATKLANTRYIFSKPFDGTNNVSGGAKFVNICIETSNSVVDNGRGSEINCYYSPLYIQHDTSQNAFICTGGGNFGVNTTNPQYKLDVNGTIRSQGLLNSTYNGITSIFGTQNGSYCHMMTTAPQFYFEKSASINGDLYSYIDGGHSLGSSSDRWGEAHVLGWYRSYGDTGWYNAKHGGGIYMSDDTYVKVYNKAWFRSNHFSSGDYQDDSYSSAYNCAGDSGKNECLYSFIRSGIVAFGMGYTTNNEIWLGNPTTNRTLGKWFILSGSGGTQIRGNLLTYGGITMYYYSDKNLKVNPRPVTNASERLMSLGGVYDFEYIDSEVARNSIYAGTHTGLIYQNVKGGVLDCMAYEREDGKGALNYIDPSFISLLAAVGIEHEGRIEVLERENKELKERIRILEGRFE
nr:MAG TPA: endosialidase chaperone [Caudoviricetes sp.]